MTAVIDNPTHPAFEKLRSHRIDTLNLDVEEYRHKKTGARHLHLAADNEENVFFVALRTFPMDSTGVAHVLEHTALCGSERYPVRDPFFIDDSPFFEYVYERVHQQRLDGLSLREYEPQRF